jgi:ABC-2 type transport system permease protein
MRWKRINSIIKKDVKSILGNKRIIFPMTITPLSLLVFTPILFIYSLKTGQSFNLPSSFINNLPIEIKQNIINFTQNQKLIYLFANYIMAALFLMLPLMICSWISSASMIQEKDNKTMETLLYAPITKLELFLGKIFGSYIPSLFVTYLGLLIYTVSLYYLTNDYFGFFILQKHWIYIAFLLLPTSLLFGVIANILASTKAKNVQEAQQFSIIVTFPFMMLLVGQMMGGLYINNNFIIILSIIFIFIDVVCIYIISKKFKNESILKM